MAGGANACVLHYVENRDLLKDGDLLLIDSHDRPVSDPVWTLYEEDVIGRTGPIATLVEWDSDLPEWPVLRGEAEAANAILRAHRPQLKGRRHAALA